MEKFCRTKNRKKKNPQKSFFFLFLTFRLSGEKIYFEQLKLSYNETRDNF